MTIALTSTKWTLDLITRLARADIRVHNAEAIREDMAIIYVVNHFTRLETMLLPYVLHKHTGQYIWSLAADELFRGRIGSYLRQTGTISTKDPDRDKVIVRTVLTGEHPWIIFPEGAMVKDKKVVAPDGGFEIYSSGMRRPPHTGAAVLALRAEFYRHKLTCLRDAPNAAADLERVLAQFELDSLEQALTKRTVVVPVNVTYYPIRSGDNLFLRMARSMMKDLSPRMLEELSVEGTVLSEDTDIDITLGDPIDVRAYLQAPEYAELMACGDRDLEVFEGDPRSLFNDAARRLMVRYMADIYRLTRINFDHVFATIIRYQEAPRFTERAYRNRIFLCVHALKDMGQHQLHNLLAQNYREIIYEEPNPKFTSFVELCLREKLLLREGDAYVKNFDLEQGRRDFHTVRQHELTYVIANEVEPLTLLTGTIRELATAPRDELSERIRTVFLEEDRREFEEDYERNFQPGVSKDKEVGQPFLLVPPQIQGGIVLVHGYLAAPLEVRTLAEYFYRKGYAVYGVRLKGHGTAPDDLIDVSWQDWYESMNRGYAIIKSLTDYIVLGGFSMGGVLALRGAARKGTKIQAVFSINAPVQLVRYTARLASSGSLSMHALLKRIKGDFVDNDPENPHINYTRNPLHGVQELGKATRAMEEALPQIAVPALVVQGAHDPIVDPASGFEIFEAIGTPDKELSLFERSRHGIINGDDVEPVFDRVSRFLTLARRQAGHHTTASVQAPQAAPEAREAHVVDR